MKNKIIITIFSLFTALDLTAQTNQLTAVIGAIESEVKVLRSELTDVHEEKIMGLSFSVGKMGDRNVVICRGGIGKVNAAMATTLLIEHYNPHEVLFTGIAGGINPERFPGDIVIAEKTIHHDYGEYRPKGLHRNTTNNPVNRKQNPLYFPGDTNLLSVATNVAALITLKPFGEGEKQRMPKITSGIVATGDTFISSNDKREELRSGVQADAVEMEGAAVAQVCYEQGIPCLIIRSISDMANEHASKDIKDFGRIAADNSATLVKKIISGLSGAASTPEDLSKQPSL